MANNRRSFRYPAHLAQREATLFVGEEVIAAAIVDESAGGMGVVVADASGLLAGRLVDFEEEVPSQGRRVAKITHVRPDDFELFRIGLEWV